MTASLLLALGLFAGPRAAQAAQAPPPVRIAADRVTQTPAAVVAEGAVELVFPESTCTADRAELHRESQRLVLEAGQCVGAEGTVTFRRAEVDLGGSAGLLVDARLEPGGLVVTAERIVRVTPDRFEGEGAWVSLCGCDPAPWSLEAREVEVQADEVVRFRGGWIRVCALRLVPVPRGALPLAPRRTGLLPPQVGWGRDGTVASAPVMLTLGRSADLVAAPEWRAERGLRGLGEARLGLAPGESASVAGFAGWDEIRRESRGALRVEQGWTPGWARSAIDGQWLSDDAVLTDFEDSFLNRSAPWTEQRALLGLGPVRLETNRFVPLQDQRLRSRLASVVVARGGVALGPASWSGRVRADSIGVASGALGGRAENSRLLATSTLRAGRTLGPTRWTGSAGTQLVGWDDTRGRVEGRLGGAGWLDLWGDVGPLRHLAAVGVEASAARWTGDSRWRLADERPGRPWQIGPALQSSWVGAQGVPVRLEARAPWTPSGFRPVGLATVQLGPWQAAGQAGRSLQDLRLLRDDGVLRIGAGSVTRPDLAVLQAEAAWRLPGPLREFRPGVAGARDLLAGGWLSRTASLSWTSRCDCLGAVLGATWSADRAVPDLQARVTFR